MEIHLHAREFINTDHMGIREVLHLRILVRVIYV